MHLREIIKFKAPWRRRGTRRAEEEPLRSGLLGQEQAQKHARLLALSHVAVERAGEDLLLPRLGENERIIRESHHVVQAATRKGQRPAPAGEWLLDNFFLIEDQIEIAREHLPPHYSRELPHLTSGSLRGYPRVYELAMELVSHTDGRVDMGNLSAFVRAYQAVVPLKLGELWALPIMLRLALLENLRRVAHRVAWRRRDRDDAQEWTQRFLAVVRREPKALITELAEFVRLKPTMSQSFIAELITNLHGEHPSLQMVVSLIEQDLHDLGQTIEQILQAESHDQASDQVSLGNSITSLRALAGMDWHEFVESLSATEAILRRDPSGVYPRMNFRTRDKYRHVVERLSRRSGKTETQVAQAAVDLSGESLKDSPPDLRRGHVGWFLIDAGLQDLERAIGYRPGVFRRTLRAMRRHGLAMYMMLILIVTAGLGLPLAILSAGFDWPWWALALGGIALAIVASQVAITLVNWLLTAIVPARGLPRMDFVKGVPDACRTVVAVPTMLTSPAGVESLLENIEIRHLANRDGNIMLALLTDFCDAPDEKMPQDDELLELAAAGIERLNQQYAPEGGDLFFLLHRPRVWNDRQRAWMGYERKRGKLLELNKVLRGGEPDAFSRVVGDMSRLRTALYVITLDTDTQLPPGAARRLIAAMAHPLNRPRIDPKTGCVTGGYGVLQPRVAIGLSCAKRSTFARIFAGEVGIDPYTREVSNVYQDVMDCTPYVGKGIYEVSAFDAAVGRRFPPNRILSHDLIEGSYARCGYINDVELIEEHPSDYLTDAKRRHRWARGDWQIARWMLPRVPGLDGSRQRNPICLIWRWMIFDNLRRSLASPALLALLAACWLGPWDLRPACTGLLVGLYLLPEILRLIGAWLLKGRKISWRSHLERATVQQGKPWAIKLLHLALLPYEAMLHLHAIAQVAWRLMISRRNTLTWQAPQHQEDGASFEEVLRKTWISPFTAVAILVAVTIFHPVALATAGIFIVAWFLGPLLVYAVSRPSGPRKSELTGEDLEFLRRVTRRTWAYFHQFVDDSNMFLPPDNFQVSPEPKVARRTSPTNIGLSLLADLTAWDMGYLSAGEMITRLNRAFGSIDRLERHRGHLFNWYDISTGGILRPAYVSTVDSGNLACCLIALRGGLAEVMSSPILPPAWLTGLRDTAGVLADEAMTAQKQASSPAARDDLETLDRILQDCRRLGPVGAPDLGGSYSLLEDWNARLEDLEHLAGDDDVAYWLSALRQQAADLRGDLLNMAPWLRGAPGLLDEAEPLARKDAGASADLAALRKLLADAATLQDLAGLESSAGPVLRRLADIAAADVALRGRLAEFERQVAESSRRAEERISQFEEMIQLCREMSDIPLDFLYDVQRKLLSIGYSVESHRLDTGYYDLLASEARATSFLGIAQGKLPQDHWFTLNRRLTSTDGAVTLMSWSGSMFEYLMPMLFMPNFEGTLLDLACRSASVLQVQYGRRHGVPWGISESAFNQVDTDMNYQYRAFGVPQLGLKRGLADDLVIAPYASIMALATLPGQACQNLRQLAQMGLIGRYGFFEAVDFTPTRVPPGDSFAVVHSYMAHHSGMSLLGLNYILKDAAMPRRFQLDGEVRASLLLLQERLPPVRAPHIKALEEPETPVEGEKPVEAAMRVYTDPAPLTPQVHLLSNGRYNVMVTASGSGYSRWQDTAITRWREDLHPDSYGQFLYLKDVDNNASWSCTPQPMAPRPQRYEATFSQARAEYRLVAQDVESHLTISVSPEDDVETRSLTLTNLSGRRRVLELTSFAEIALTDPRAEMSHPVFHSLFIQTELLPERMAVLCTRRARSSEESPPWMFHTLSVQGSVQQVSFETDRKAFIGRTRRVANPTAMDRAGPLKNSQGSVLDPCAAVRVRIVLEAGEDVTVNVLTGISPTREQAVGLLDKYRDPRLADRIFDLAWTQSQVMLYHLRITEGEAQMFLRLAGSLVLANSTYRPSPNLIGRNRKRQADLWRYGISGDLPILVVRVTERAGLDLVRSALQAHAYLRYKGLRLDLVIWADAFAGYRQSLLDEVVGLVNLFGEGKSLNQHGGIFIRGTDQLPPDDQLLLQAAARVFLSDRSGTLAEQILRRVRGEPTMANLRPTRPPEVIADDEYKLPPRELVFFNGLGGFTPDGREYVTMLESGRSTDAPWSNILANAEFGSVVTESGGGYTWFGNAHEFRLSPWYNDPVTDRQGEIFYIRDEETGRYWSPTPMPARGPTPYVCRHGLGYTVFEHTQHGIFSELTQYVAMDAPVKFYLFKLRNVSDRDRRLSVSGMIELVLGELRSLSGMHVVTQLDPLTGAIFATNYYSNEYSGRVVFFDCTDRDRTFTADRTEFIGRNRNAQAPQAMSRRRLSNRVGAALDPCAAIQAYLTIPAGGEYELAFMLGAAADENQARYFLNRFNNAGEARQSQEQVWEFWKHLLGGVYVETPDASVNFMANHWLLYQSLACRYWARSGYYQSGGAWGFRDQLQDSSAFLHECPWLIREHLLRAASRQFREGDVQHWWHPPGGRGVRTHISDDYLWLPWTVCRYTGGTGDTGVLDEMVPFLTGRALRADEESYYDLPEVADKPESLYEHCRRAIHYGLRTGSHGLPLMGCGDWNDGLNRVGKDGKGQSVWLAFFLHDVLRKFAPLAKARGDEAFSDFCLAQAASIRGRIASETWDGKWYLRAFFDDGQPLGSSASPECQIDSLPQSWSVLSGVGEEERSVQAMKSTLERLVDRELGIVKLFTPPFDKAPWDVGYIRGYVPGVRENGGQYTHAAVWVAMALAEMRRPREAWEIASMLLPPARSATPEGIARYQVEPYVLAADIYSAQGHAGKGGWTWYTGSAAWLYRLLIESLLGIDLRVDKLSLAPVVPADWKSYRIHYRWKSNVYHITINIEGPETWNVRRLAVDGNAQEDKVIHLSDDHAEHYVDVVVG